MSTKREDMTLRLARHMVRTGDTVRMCAHRFALSKSAVHKMLGTPLEKLHPGLYRDVRAVMEYHKQVKHLRGGEATRQKYLSLRAQTEKDSPKNGKKQQFPHEFPV